MLKYSLSVLDMQTNKDELLKYLENSFYCRGVDSDEIVERFATKWNLSTSDVKDCIQKLVNSRKVKREGGKIYHWIYLTPSEGSVEKTIPRFIIRV
jgi:hypothetical protein